jgi:hypothetical protein
MAAGNGKRGKQGQQWCQHFSFDVHIGNPDWFDWLLIRQAV